MEVATFDPDTFIDFRARRPLMQIRDGVNERLVWPEIKLRAGQLPDGRSVLLLTGHEPDSAWHAFVDAATTLAAELGATKMVGLGAYPFAAPHTRPPRVSMTASSQELADTLPFGRNSVDVPAGVQAALEQRFAALGLPAVGLWAQVPHYVSGFPYPGGVGGPPRRAHRGHRHPPRRQPAAGGGGHPPPAARRAGGWERRAHRDGPPARARLRRRRAKPSRSASAATCLPGDELAAELERFLRDQGR